MFEYDLSSLRKERTALEQVKNNMAADLERLLNHQEVHKGTVLVTGCVLFSVYVIVSNQFAECFLMMSRYKIFVNRVGGTFIRKATLLFILSVVVWSFCWSFFFQTPHK